MSQFSDRIRSASPAVKTAVFGLCALVVALILELFLFNYRFWQTRDYEPVEVEPYTWDTAIQLQSDGTWFFPGNGLELFFKDIDTPVHNIRLVLEDVTDFGGETTWRNDHSSNVKLLEQVTVSIILDDYANMGGLIMPTRTVVSGVPSTQYITVHTTGTTHKLGIQFEDVSGRTLRIDHIVLNSPVPLDFRVVRVLLLVALALIIYTCRCGSALHRVRLNWASRRQRVVILLFAAATVLLGLWLIQSNVLLVRNQVYFSEDYCTRYNMLTDALLSGHLYVDKAVDPAILDLENPYDPAALSSIGVQWSDFAYYHGRYYVYFGIVPVLLFYLPAKVLFGVDITACQCMIILIPFFVAGCFLLMYRLVTMYRRGSQPVSLIQYLLLTELFLNGTFGLFGLASPDMYYLPIFTAITLMVWGLWFWLTALKDPEEPTTFHLGDCSGLSCWRLAAGSLCIALLAGSRPQFLAAAFLALPIFWRAVFRQRFMFSAKGWRQTLCFLAPFLVFGAFICWYNWARFGSIIDFGATYNQTSNDMTSRGFSIARFFQGLFYYVLQPTTWGEAFPFLHAAVHNTQYTGTNIFETTYGGILFLQPATLLLGLVPRLRAGLKAHGTYWVVLIAAGFGIIIAGLDSVIAAVLARYYLDFGVFFLLAAVIVWLELTSREDEALGAFGRRALLPLTLFALAVSVLLVFNVIQGENDWYANPNRFTYLKTLIEFWY